VQSLKRGRCNPADASIFGYAETAGIPVEYLALSWYVFCTKARETKNTQKDWRQTYRNYVGGGCFLSVGRSCRSHNADATTYIPSSMTLSQSSIIQ
jgi:hypothetical protein